MIRLLGHPGPGPSLARPGLRHGDYPQREVPPSSLGWELADLLGDLLGDGLGDLLRRLGARVAAAAAPARRAAARVAELQAAAAALQAAGTDLAAAAQPLRAQLLRHGLTPELSVRALALVAAAARAEGAPPPHAGQWLAALEMLGGRLVEMATGEGKSLALLLAAGAAALAGVPVHLVTSNDALAARDAAAGAPVLRRLGLAGAAVQATMAAAERRAAYAADVTWCTARELGFDYLRDRLALAAAAGAPAPTVMRGLSMALVDEADSVLIDHARTPLVIAVRSELVLDEALLRDLWALSATIEIGREARLDAVQRQAELADGGLARLQALLARRPGPAPDPRVAEQVLSQALVVRHLLQRDHHYLVAGGEVQLIDATTGRVNPGTQWTRGVQQLVALKEGLAPPPQTRSAEQITLQNLFARYWLLAGTSGTLRGARLELLAFYRRGIRLVPPRQPSRRRDLGTRVFADEAAWLAAIAQRAAARREAGQPVLIGCGSVAEAERVQAHLEAAGLPAALLHARHEADEAARVAAAGEAGAITVTTNLAGRGTHIALSPAARAAGGLHAMLCTLNPSARIDRQFLGRCARQGEPGSSETLLAVNNGAFAAFCPAWMRGALRTIAAGGQGLPRPLGRGLQIGIQESIAWRDFRQRWQMVSNDRRMREMLSHARGAV